MEAIIGKEASKSAVVKLLGKCIKCGKCPCPDAEVDGYFVYKQRDDGTIVCKKCRDIR